MRLWSIHPCYLDAKGLVGLWREALLAQRVIRGQTSAYSKHPQIHRFRAAPDPQVAIAAYLTDIWEEGNKRGYRFRRERIGKEGKAERMAVTRGQVEFELRWLERKLKKRCPGKLCDLPLRDAKCHPSFFIVEGEKESWEKGNLDSIQARKPKRKAKLRASDRGRNERPSP